MRRVIPAEDRAKAERLLRCGERCNKIALACHVSYPWVLRLREQLGLTRRRVNTPALRPAPKQVSQPFPGPQVNPEDQDAAPVGIPTVPAYARLSDGFLLKAAEMLEAQQDRHLTPATWEMVAPLFHAAREVVDLRRLLDLRNGARTHKGKNYTHLEVG